MSRLLCAAYALLLIWLAWCAVTCLENGAPAYASIFFVASWIPLAAWFREDTITTLRREVAVYAERAARPRPQPTEKAGRYDQAWADLEAVCCLTAWETSGRLHDPNYCTRKDHQ